MKNSNKMKEPQAPAKVGGRNPQSSAKRQTISTKHAAADDSLADAGLKAASGIPERETDASARSGSPKKGGRKASDRSKPPKPPFPPRIAKSAEVVELANGEKIMIAGVQDEGGTKYVLFASSGHQAIVPYSDFHSGGRGLTKLGEQGLIVVSDSGALREAVAKLSRFPQVPIVTQPGWSRYGFVQSNLKVLRAAGAPMPRRAMKPASGLLDSGGNLASWAADVAAPLAEHDLAAFCMMLMFAAALLRLTNRSDNFGFELVGEAGKGKSTLQLVIATAAGPAVGDGDTTYWRSLNSTVNALEETLQAYQDMPLILDEAALLSGSGRTEVRGLVMRDLAFRFSDGRPRHRFRDPVGPRARLVYLMSSNRSIYSLLGTSHAAETTAIADRLITLPVLSERPFGVFDRCPEGYSSTGAFADALRVAASQHYGHAMPAYLTYLVERQAKAPEKLRRAIADYMGRFVERSGADQNDGSQLRVAEAFGLVFTAGCLAKAAGVLPDNYRCMRSALAIFELHRNHGRVPVSFQDRLQALIRHPDTINLAELDIGTLSTAVHKACSVYLYRGRSGGRELLIPAEYINRVFPGWNGMRYDAEIVQHSKRSSDRLTVDRPVGLKGSQQPVYCFDISSIDS